MKRILCSVLILVIILSFCCWSLWKIDRVCSDTTEMLRKAEQQCLLGDFEKAEALVQGSSSNWERHKAFLGITMRHSDLNIVHIAFPTLAEACRQKNMDEFSMRNRELIATLSAIVKLEWPHFYHIL